MNILFIASVAVIAPAPAESRKLYVDALGLPLKRHEGDDYFFSEELQGAKHFGVWPLAQAAQALLRRAAMGLPRIRAAGQHRVRGRRRSGLARGGGELADRGHVSDHGARWSPWGQMVARLQSAEGGARGDLLRAMAAPAGRPA